MRFLYKIHSGYDGFRPAVLPDRMDGRRLRLAWRHYIEVVETGWECWVYFHGPHKFENGVYAKGIVDGIDLAASEVSLRVREYKTDRPITSRKLSARVAEAVGTRYRQVFLWPDDWTVAPQCEVRACTAKQCGDCETWAKLPLIGEGEATTPSRLQWSTYEDVVAAHWIVPSRCYETRIRTEVRDLTRRFTEFKLGDMAYGFPFALSIFEATPAARTAGVRLRCSDSAVAGQAGEARETPNAGIGQGTRSPAGSADAGDANAVLERIQASHAGGRLHGIAVRGTLSQGPASQCAERRREDIAR